jgi:acetyl-CoA carboxylase biotin carboxyl carrier protein
LEPKQIKELMLAMGRTGIKRLCLKNKDYELELEREDQFGVRGIHGDQAFADHVVRVSEPSEVRGAKGRTSDIPPSLHPPVGHAETLPHVQPGTFVTSPMVGTFYSSPGPDEPHFIKVGDKITKDTVVCIIEAMKVMNEVKAGKEGIVTEILVENGHPVEFGTKLFKIS